jgi:hypothetical protein
LGKQSRRGKGQKKTESDWRATGEHSDQEDVEVVVIGLKLDEVDGELERSDVEIGDRGDLPGAADVVLVQAAAATNRGNQDHGKKPQSKERETVRLERKKNLSLLKTAVPKSESKRKEGQPSSQLGPK